MRERPQLVRSPLLLLAWLPLITLLSTPSAQAMEVKDVVAAVQKTYAETEDLQADFKQEMTFQGFSAVHHLNGKLYLKKPGKMRWDYQSPSKQQIFLEGEHFTYYIPEHQQVVISTLSRQHDREIPIHLLATLSTLERDFNLQWEEEPGQNPQSLRIRLLPKQGGVTSNVTVDINPKDHFIYRIALADPNGNTSIFTFSKIETNKGVPDRLFTFTPPKGVEIVHPPPLQ